MFGRLHRKYLSLNPSRPKIASYIKKYLGEQKVNTFSVHSVFKNVVNYSDGYSLFSISNSTTAMTPTSIVLDELNLYEKFLNYSRSGFVLNLDYPILIMQELQLSVLNAEVIDTKIELYSSPPTNYIERFQKEVCQYTKNRKGIIELFHKDRCSDVVVGRIGEILNALRQNILWNDTETFKRNLGKLLGLGYGLTPSGDDFIYGFFAALKIFNFKPDLSLLIEQMIDENRNRIGDISFNSLNSLRCGHIFSPIKELLHSLCSGESCTNPINILLDYGATSGVDTLAGVLFALESP